MSGREVSGSGFFLGGDCPGGNCPGGNCPWGGIVRGELSGRKLSGGGIYRSPLVKPLDICCTVYDTVLLFPVGNH